MKLWHKRGNIVSGSCIANSDLIQLSDDVDFDALYFVCKGRTSYVIALHEFERVDGGRYHGVYTVSNTAAYGIVLSDDGEEAVIQCFT